ncbi:hypothetical protein GII36_02300 [Candidatus Mycosynbacter amalyticus]|uniref:Uncharacterized protein n=1 Tax=Candidatus Mycosynbacter amalyticus TaxID=2665156 RepID=A0A857MN28_9BACT|nr:hypothetical protein GII36_02300 [Candidatus Mycosynbacter amalyticus]
MRLTDTDNLGRIIKYDFEESVKDSDSIRVLALRKIQSTKEVAEKKMGYESINEATPLHLSLVPFSSESKHGSDGHSTFGIKYGLNLDGGIKILDGYMPLSYDWTFREVSELVEDGYVKGSAYHVYVRVPDGLGALGGDTFDLIGFLDSSLSLGMLGYRGMIRVWQFRRYRGLRKLVHNWKEKNGVRYPYQLREFLDEKGEWRLSEVKKRLALNEEYAVKLLAALGYEPVKDSWRLTQSKQSIKHRSNWMKNEKRYSKLAQEAQK